MYPLAFGSFVCRFRFRHCTAIFCILKIFFVLISAARIQLYFIKTKLSTIPHSNRRQRLETFSDDLQECLKFCPEGCRLDNDKHSCVRSAIQRTPQLPFSSESLSKWVCQTVALFCGVTVLVINNPAFSPEGKCQLGFKLISLCSSLTHTRCCFSNMLSRPLLADSCYC